MVVCIGCAWDRDRPSAPLPSTSYMRKKAVISRVCFSFYPCYQPAAISLQFFFIVFSPLFQFSNVLLLLLLCFLSSSEFYSKVTNLYIFASVPKPISKLSQAPRRQGAGLFLWLTFKNRASYIWDGRTATLQMLHFIYFFNKYKY